MGERKHIAADSAGKWPTKPNIHRYQQRLTSNMTIRPWSTAGSASAAHGQFPQARPCALTRLLLLSTHHNTVKRVAVLAQEAARSCQQATQQETTPLHRTRHTHAQQKTRTNNNTLPKLIVAHPPPRHIMHVSCGLARPTNSTHNMSAHRACKCKSLRLCLVRTALTQPPKRRP